MRRLLALMAILFLIAFGRAFGADREWQTGVWATSTIPGIAAPARNYAIETDRFRLDVELTDARRGPPLPAAVGKPVIFAVVNRTVYIQQGTAEWTLHLLKRTEKHKTYDASGSGHFVKAVTGDGSRLTLEDGSVWDVSPTQQFRTVGWLPFAGIMVSYDDRELPRTVLLEEDGPEFDYFLTNTDEDEGASARLVSAP